MKLMLRAKQTIQSRSFYALIRGVKKNISEGYSEMKVT